MPNKDSPISTQIKKPKNIFIIWTEYIVRVVAFYSTTRTQKVLVTMMLSCLAQLFSDVYVEDPLFMCELAHHLIIQKEQKSGTRISQKERQLAMLESVGRVMEVSPLSIELFQRRFLSEDSFDEGRHVILL